MPIFILVFFLAILAEPVFAQNVPTNPNMSVNFLVLGRGSSEGVHEEAENPNGFHLQEVELRFTSNIDAYFRGDVVLGIHREHGHHQDEIATETEEEAEAESETEAEHEEEESVSAHGWSVEPEEVYLESLSIPGVTLKVGKFFALIGKHNNLHTHYFPFIDPPVINTLILGEEGLNEIGFSLSYLLPTPWYLEMVLQGFSGSNENLFNSPVQDDLASLVFVKNLWNLTESTTLEWNFTYGEGRDTFEGMTRLYNTSFTYKWRPLEKSTRQSFSWTLEFLEARGGNHPPYEDPTGKEKAEGFVLWTQWQFMQKWWLQARTEQVSFYDGKLTKKHSALIAFTPTEYSSLRFQVDEVRETDKAKDLMFSLQWNMSMGTHPAHNY